MENLLLENLVMEYSNDLSPVIKWPGGKEQELEHILHKIPQQISRYIEPFVGGGAVYFSIKAPSKIINDRSIELINFYTDIQQKNDDLSKRLSDLNRSWERLEHFLQETFSTFSEIYNLYKSSDANNAILIEKINSFINEKEKCLATVLYKDVRVRYDIFQKELNRNIISKLKRMHALEKERGALPEQDIYDNFECALKGSFYMFVRELYNEDLDRNSHFFYFIREYCYSSMFRYNASGKFNVPYGGISYNRKNFQKKIDYIKSSSLRNCFSETLIYNLDFEDFLNTIKLKNDDFIFLDPPYDTEFSDYAKLTFNKNDQVRLANYLINKCPARFMLVIKNTDFIYNLYSDKGLHIESFDKKYAVSFKNRNNRNVEHLIIKNY